MSYPYRGSAPALHRQSHLLPVGRDQGAYMASRATQCLDAMHQHFSFPIRVIQVDGGYESRSDSKSVCRALGIQLPVPPPWAPKLNGLLERAQCTQAQESNEVYDEERKIIPLNRALLERELVYDCLRPHQSTHGGTLTEHIGKCHPESAYSPLSRICLCTEGVHLNLWSIVHSLPGDL